MILWLVACVDLGPRSAESNADCAACHPAVAAAVEASGHGSAGGTALFEALERQAAESLGVDGLCKGCHRVGEGVSCATCHTAVGTHGPGTGSLILDGAGPVLAGSDGEGAPHATVTSGLLSDSVLCATCHEVDLVGGFVEQPYSAWLRSPAADAGRHCQDCHLGTAERSHTFQGIAGGEGAALRLLWSGIEGGWRGDQLEVRNLAGHRYPDGMAGTRELWLVPDVGDRVPLHPLLLDDDGPVVSPVLAIERIERGLEPGETRRWTFVGASEVCLSYRSQALGLTRSLGLPDQPELTVGCFSR